MTLQPMHVLSPCFFQEPTLQIRWEIWVFPNIGVPQNGWFIVENPIKIDDLGVPLFLETPIYHFFTDPIGKTPGNKCVLPIGFTTLKQHKINVTLL